VGARVGGASCARRDGMGVEWEEKGEERGGGEGVRWEGIWGLIEHADRRA
jgi:hypothetical protein